LLTGGEKRQHDGARRRLSMTQAGEQLYQTAESGFDALDSVLATLAHYRQTPSGTVRINASQHAIDKCLLPKLAVFKQRYPDIRLELMSENRFVDIIPIATCRRP